MKKTEIKKALLVQRKIITEAEIEISKIAKKAIPEFHFLNHCISTFWDCDKSPTGLCVFDISEGQTFYDQSCYYCGNPTERK